MLDAAARIRSEQSVWQVQCLVRCSTCADPETHWRQEATSKTADKVAACTPTRRSLRLTAGKWRKRAGGLQ